MDHRRRFSAFVAKGQDPHSTILQANRFAREFLETRKLDARVQMKLAIIVEELVSNALRHRDTDHDLSLALLLHDEGNAVAVEMDDDGAPFDPSNSANFAGPDPVTGGGIGLAMVRAWGEDIDYARSNERNVLRLNVRG